MKLLTSKIHILGDYLSKWCNQKYWKAEYKALTPCKKNLIFYSDSNLWSSFHSYEGQRGYIFKKEKLTNKKGNKKLEFKEDTITKVQKYILSTPHSVETYKITSISQLNLPILAPPIKCMIRPCNWNKYERCFKFVTKEKAVIQKL